MISNLPTLQRDLDLRQQTKVKGIALPIKDLAGGESFHLQEAEQPELQTDGEVCEQQSIEGTTSVIESTAGRDCLRTGAEDSAAGRPDGATPGPIVEQPAEQVFAPEEQTDFTENADLNGGPETGEEREPDESGEGTLTDQEVSTESVPPKLRPDLTVSKQGKGDKLIFVVKDPVTGQFFRLREAEWFIAGQCDGTTTTEAIRQRTEEEFGAALPLAGLTAFVKKLEKTGLLESERTAQRLRKRQARIRGSLLYLRIKLLDPNRLLNRLVRKLRFCFTPYFVVFATSMVLLAGGIVATNLAEIGQGFDGFRSLLAIPVFLAVIFVVISAHEFAHGLTCKHFGGEVREMGFLLIYFQPALYCNVSDAWLFKEKSKRLWVGFAGPFFELFLWSLATVAWRVTEVGTWINYVALVVMVSSGIKTLFNFNPLIKLDGYYLLSDYLGIPNLRKKSFRYIGDRFKKLCSLDFQAAQDIPSRERSVYLVYGLIATLGSLSILSVAASKIGGFLIEQGQALALLFFTALLGTKLRRRYRRFFGRASGPSDLSDDDDDDYGDTFQESAEPEKAESVQPKTVKPMEAKMTEPARFLTTGPGEAAKKEPVEPRSAKSMESKKPEPARTEPDETGKRELVKLESEPRKKELAESGKTEAEKTESAARKQKRKRRALMRRIAFAVLAGAVVAALFLVRMELRIVGGFNILPTENADVRAAVEGIIAEIYVDEGDQVQAGDLIARLSDRDVLADLRKIEADINQTRARLKMLEAGPTVEVIEVAKAAVVAAEDEVKFAQSKLARDKSLFEQRLLAQAEYEKTQEETVTAQNDLIAAQGRLNVLLKGSRPEEIDATRAAVDGLETQRAHLEQQLQLLKIVSPATGIVATPTRQLKEMRRQLVSKGALIAKIYELKKVTAEIVVPETEIADIKVGHQVALKARSYPDQTFYGRVTSIATAVQASSSSTGATPATSSGSVSASSKTILVTTVIDNSSLLLKAQMTGQAKIFCGQQRIFDLVTRRLARTVKVEFWSWW